LRRKVAKKKHANSTERLLNWGDAGASGQAVAYNEAKVTMKPYTAKQGQYLAFIFYYTKIHGVAPAEYDMQKYFKVSPPSVHQMVVTLEVNGFIERVPGQGRSIRLVIPREELPDLE
jgi:DNA-binding MarR family transcriptional regulator